MKLSSAIPKGLASTGMANVVQEKISQLLTRPTQAKSNFLLQAYLSNPLYSRSESHRPQSSPGEGSIILGIEQDKMPLPQIRSTNRTKVLFKLMIIDTPKKTLPP